tara:strand:+ start:100 stop:291 length:192 start_codon:yes stop_codon:yes gene_type:complete
LSSEDRVESTSDEEDSVAESEPDNSVQDEGLDPPEAVSTEDEVDTDPDGSIGVEDVAEGEKDG